jgi:hypothetical protein
MSHPVITAWHRVVDSRDPSGLDDAGRDAVFTPVVIRPQRGRRSPGLLTAAMQVLTARAGLLRGSSRPMTPLEFETVLDGVVVNGVDLIRWTTAAGSSTSR